MRCVGAACLVCSQQPLGEYRLQVLMSCAGRPQTVISRGEDLRCVLLEQLICTMVSVQGFCGLQTAILRKQVTVTKACLTDPDSKRSAGQQHEAASARVQMEEPCVCDDSIDTIRAKVNTEALACACAPHWSPRISSPSRLRTQPMRCYAVAAAVLPPSCIGAS